MRGEQLMLREICSYSVYGFLQTSIKEKLLADHYVSNRRFLNIIEKESELTD